MPEKEHLRAVGAEEQRESEGIKESARLSGLYGR
jgi:hypothetical protein